MRKLAAFSLFALLTLLLSPVPPVAQAGPVVPGCTQWGGYPWVNGGCLNGQDINNAFSFNPSSLPPQNEFGQGALYGKLWLDTSTVPATLRECLISPNCSASYISSQWAIWGTLGSGIWTPFFADGTSVLPPSQGGTGINNGTFTLMLGGSTSLPAAPASTQCLHMSPAGAISPTGGDCVPSAANLLGSTGSVFSSVNVSSGLSLADGNLTAPLFTSGAQGETPASGGGTINFLRADGTFAPPPGGTGGGSVQLNTSALIETIPNSSTGTGNSLLVILTSSGGITQVETATTGSASASNVVGICQSGVTNASCGTTGNAAVAIDGQAQCAFDGATTANDFVTPSTTVAGDCHDAGAALPTGVQVIGYAQSTNGAAGTYGVDISNMGVAAALSAKARAGGSTGQVQYNSGGNAFGGIANSSCDGSGNCSWGGTQSFGSVTGSARQVTGTTDTLLASDCGAEIVYTNAGTVSVTTLANIAPGKVCAIAIQQEGAGAVQIVDGAGATHVSTSNSCPSAKTSAQYAIMQLTVQPFDPSEYKVGGECS